MATTTPARSAAVTLEKDAADEVVLTPAQQNVPLLAALLADMAKGASTEEPKVFTSKNTGLYVAANLKAPDARALGITVPVGGKVKLTIQAVVIDPANSKDA